MPDSDESPGRRRLLVFLLLVLLVFLGSYHNLVKSWMYDLPLGTEHYFPTATIEVFHKMSEVDAAMKGYYLVGNPFHFEERFITASNTPGGPAFFGIFLRLIRMNLATTTWFFDLLMPVIVFALFMLMLRRLEVSSSTTHLAIASFLFTLVLMMAPQQRLLYRYLSPQMSLPLYLYLFMATALLERRKVEVVEYGFMLALNAINFIIDPWMAVLVVGTQSLLVLKFIWRRDHEYAARVFMLVLSGMLGGAAEILRLSSLHKEDGFQILAARMGQMDTFVPSYPVFLVWVVLLGVLCFIAWRFRCLTSDRFLMTFGWMAMIVCVAIFGQNVVTGKRVYFQGEHIASTSLIAMGLVAADSFFGLMARLKSRGIRHAVLLTMILAATLHHVASARGELQLAIPTNRFDELFGYDPMRMQVIYGKSFRWLRENAPETNVVLCDPVVALPMRLIANKYGYFVQSAIHISRNQQQIYERYFPFIWMRRQVRIPTPPDPIWHTDEKLHNYNPRDYGMVYASAGSRIAHIGLVNAALKRRGLSPVFDEEPERLKVQSFVDAIYDGYDSFVHGRDIRGLKDMLDYRCDMVLWGPQERRMYPDYQPESDATLVPIHRDEENQVTIFGWR